jgi:DnaJ family protein A protein 5
LEKVRAFYNYWENFATVKSFMWADKYRHERDHNRFVRRLIDQDNKKSRNKAKKNYLAKIK